MDWIQLAGAIGVGAIATKLLDILWLQRLVLENERKRWLREKRLRAFSRLSGDLLTMGLTRTDPNSFVEGYRTATEAMLLVNDDQLAEKIDGFIVRIDKFHELERQPPPNRVESERLYVELQAEARELVYAFRKSLTSD